MRYANTKHKSRGIGIEPQGGKMSPDTSVLITDKVHNEQVRVYDKEQLQKMIDLLRDASVLCGWGSVK